MCELTDLLAQKQRVIDRLRIQIASTSTTQNSSKVDLLSGVTPPPARSILDSPLIDLASVWMMDGGKKMEPNVRVCVFVCMSVCV